MGAGNVAWHLGRACSDAGIGIKRIINRSKEAGLDLARKLNTVSSTDFNTPLPDCDFVIVTVKDSALKDLLCTIQSGTAILLHTSGSHDMRIFPSSCSKNGVLYPFQTLTKGFSTEFNHVPLCIEASDDETLSSLRNLASLLSSNIWELTSEQRRYLHVSGIMINNFTNYLITRSFDFMNRHKLDHKLIIPLLNETIRKIEHITPIEAQTGPARRKDLQIIRKHLDLLSDEPELKNLYSMLTDSIIAYYSELD